ncbi:MAG: Qat anti-phage system TatD family nuclease QatD [Parvibaculaceae bacterium]
MALIDFHCHLDLYPDPHDVVLEAERRGVYILSVTTTPSAFLGTLKLASAASRIRTALGLHPEIAVARESELALFEELLPCTDYVGEVGLDGSRPHKATLDHQGAILSTILGLCARDGGKTISLHSRGAPNLLLDIIASEPLAGRPVLHWFGGSERETSRAAELGCWFSVGAPMLRSENGRRSVARMPRERILPETDGPFGKQNGRASYPWEAINIANDLQSILHMTTIEIEKLFTENFQKLISITNSQSRLLL